VEGSGSSAVLGQLHDDWPRSPDLGQSS